MLRSVLGASRGQRTPTRGIRSEQCALPMLDARTAPRPQDSHRDKGHLGGLESRDALATPVLTTRNDERGNLGTLMKLVIVESKPNALQGRQDPFVSGWQLSRHR